MNTKEKFSRNVTHISFGYSKSCPRCFSRKTLGLYLLPVLIYAQSCPTCEELESNAADLFLGVRILYQCEEYACMLHRI